MKETDITIYPIIIRYLDGSATIQEKHSLLQWLQESPGNQKEYVLIRDIWLSAGTSTGADEETDKAFMRFKNRVGSAEAVRKTRSFLLWGTSAVAACLFLLLGMGLGSIITKDIPQPETLFVKECQLITTAGSKGKFVLPDSTVVWLNGESRLSYPEIFCPENRTVKVEGQAYFEVKPDQQKPFIVQAGDLTLEVLGTSFTVFNYTESEIVDVALLTGKVKISVPISEEDILMEPDYFFEYRKTEQLGILKEVDAQLYNQWINNKLVFDNRTLGDVFTVLEGWFNVRINVSQELESKYGISFTVRDEPVEEVLRGLSKIAPIRYIIERSEIRILPR